MKVSREVEKDMLYRYLDLLFHYAHSRKGWKFADLEAPSSRRGRASLEGYRGVADKVE